MGAEVRVRCAVKGCNRTLATIGGEDAQRFPEEGAPEWDEPGRVAWVPSCLKHGGIPTTLDEVNAQRAERGVEPVDPARLMHAIPWADLRAAWRESTRRGRAADYFLAPKSRRV